MQSVTLHVHLMMVRQYGNG